MTTLIDDPEVMLCGCLLRDRVVRHEHLVVVAHEIWVCEACRERGLTKHEAAVALPVAALLPPPESRWRSALRAAEWWAAGALVGIVIGAAIAAGGLNAWS